MEHVARREGGRVQRDVPLEALLETLLEAPHGALHESFLFLEGKLRSATVVFDVRNKSPSISIGLIRYS